MAIPGAHIKILGRGVAWSRLGADVPKLHQNVGTCMGLVGQVLSQNWCSQKNMLVTPPPPPLHNRNLKILEFGMYNY